jgi:chromosome segregation ATPase
MRGKYSNFDQAYGAWRQMVDKGLSSRYGVLSNQIAFAETLMMEAQKEGRSEDALNILSDLAQFGTTAGQAVQALSLIKRLSPEGQLMHYNRVVENFANSGKKGKTPANVQTVMTTQEDIDKLLNSMTELRKLKRFEANGGKMTEAVARRIAELEKEIEALQTKLAPQLEKYNRLVQEKNATTLERNKLKREEKTLPKNIKDTEERIKNLRAEIDDLNNELEPKRMELQAKLADEDLAKEEGGAVSIAHLPSGKEIDDWMKAKRQQEIDAEEKAKQDYIKSFIDPDNPRELTEIFKHIAEELYMLKNSKADREVRMCR